WIDPASEEVERGAAGIVTQGLRIAGAGQRVQVEEDREELSVLLPCHEEPHCPERVTEMEPARGLDPGEYPFHAPTGEGAPRARARRGAGWRNLPRRRGSKQAEMRRGAASSPRPATRIRFAGPAAYWFWSSLSRYSSLA